MNRISSTALFVFVIIMPSKFVR